MTKTEQTFPKEEGISKNPPDSASKPSIPERVISTDAISCLTGGNRDDKSHLRPQTAPRLSTSAYSEKGYADVTNAYESWIGSLANEGTKKEYSRIVKRFLTQHNKPLNQVSSNDVTQFVMSYPTWSRRNMALTAMRSFLGYTLKRPPNTKRIKIGQKPEPKPILEPSRDEIAKLMAKIDEQPLAARAALRVLVETGHRRNAIMLLPRASVQMRELGPVIEYTPSIEKKRTSSVCPITRATYGLLIQLLAMHKEPVLFPCSAGVWHKRGHWLYNILQRAGREAGINTRLYPHLFRHMKALELRRSGAETDTVCNLLGWRDPTVYNIRYGRRPAYETCEEARGLLTEPDQTPQKQSQGPQRKNPVELIGELAQMLKMGIIDLPTYQASLTMINQGVGKEIKVQGYG